MAVSVGEIEATLKLRDELSVQLKKAESSLTTFTGQIQSTGQGTDKLDALMNRLGTTLTGMESGFDKSSTSLSKFSAIANQLSGSGAIQAAEDYAEAIQHIGGVSKLTASEQEQANKVFGEANDKLAALGKQGNQTFKQLQEATTKQTSTFDKLNEGLGTLGISLGGLSAAGIVGTFTKLASESIHFASAINDLRAATGLTTSEIQRLGFAGEKVGVSMPEVARGVQILQRNLVEAQDAIERGDEASQKMVNALQRVGLTIDQLISMSPGEMFETIADRIAKIPNPAERTATAIQLLGRSGVSLLPLLTQNVKELEEGVIEMSEETIENLDRVDDAWAALKVNIKSATGELLGIFLSSSQDTSFQKSMLTNGNAVGGFIKSLIDAKQGIMELKATIDVFTGKSTQDWNAALNDATEAVKRLPPAVRGLPPPLKSAETAMREFEAANGEALKHIDDGVKKFDAYASKIKSLRDALTGKNIADELTALRDAVKGLSEEQKKNPEIAKRIAEAFEDLAKKGAKLNDEENKLVKTTLLFASGVVTATATLPKLSDGLSVTGEEIKKMRQQMDAAANNELAALNKEIERFNGLTNTQAGLKSLFKGGVSGTDITKMRDQVVAMQDATKIGLKNALFDAANSFPDMLAKAIIHGQGLAEAFRSILVQGAADIGEILGKGMAESDSEMSKFLGSAFGALGGILGDVLGKGILALLNINKNVTKETREEFAKSMGFDNLGKLYDDLAQLGTQGQKLADIGLNVVGRKDEAANRKWMEDVQAFYQMIQTETEKVNESLGRTDITWRKEVQNLVNTTSGFGEVIQKQLGGALTGLTDFLTSGSDILAVKSEQMAVAVGSSIAAIFDKLRSSGASTIEALEEVSPAVDALDKQLQTAGVDGGAAFNFIKGAVGLLHDDIVGPVLKGVEGLGSALIGLNNTALLNQDTFSALTGQITSAFNALISQGKDGDQLIRLMAGPLQTIWELQKDFGFAVDEATQALLDQAAAAGVVGEAQRDPLERMIAALDHISAILEAIAKKFGAIPSDAASAANGINDAFRNVDIEVPVKFNWSDIRPPDGFSFEGPSFAEGTGGKYLDFGKGTLAMLHGRERVMTADETGDWSGGDTVVPVTIKLDDRVIAEAVARVAKRHGQLVGI